MGTFDPNTNTYALPGALGGGYSWEGYQEAFRKTTSSPAVWAAYKAQLDALGGAKVASTGAGYNVASSPVAVANIRGTLAPPPPHPDASDQSLGPNLGGGDAVTFPGESSASQQQSGGGGGLLLLLGAGLLVILLARKK